MKKLIILFTFFIASNVFSQNDEYNNYDKVKAAKTSYISSKINLTPEQSEKFWPIYNYHKNKIAQYNTLRDRKLLNINIDHLSEVEAKKYFTNQLNLYKKIQAERELMYQKIVKILSYKQILKLSEAEYSFRKTLLFKLKE